MRGIALHVLAHVVDGRAPQLDRSSLESLISAPPAPVIVAEPGSSADVAPDRSNAIADAPTATPTIDASERNVEPPTKRAKHRARRTRHDDASPTAYGYSSIRPAAAERIASFHAATARREDARRERAFEVVGEDERIECGSIVVTVGARRWRASQALTGLLSIGDGHTGLSLGAVARLEQTFRRLRVALERDMHARRAGGGPLPPQAPAREPVGGTAGNLATPTKARS